MNVNPAKSWLYTLFASLLLAAGCATTPAPDNAPQLTFQPVPAHAGDPTFTPPAGGTQATWNADPTRLPDDVHRAIRRSHWGVLHLISSQENLKNPAENAASEPVRVAAAALLPDDREAHILAQQHSPDSITVSIRVGDFGDPDTEKTWLRELARTLAGPPMPERYRYELPDF